MSTYKEALQQAVQAIKQQDYNTALQAAKQAVQLKPDSFDANLACGKAAYHVGSFAEAQQAYVKAQELQPDNLQVWKGLRELKEAAGDTAGTMEAYQRLLDLTPSSDHQLRLEYRLRLGQCQLHSGQFAAAEHTMQQLLSAEEGGQTPHGQERLAMLCMLAEARIPIEDAAVEIHLEHKVAKFKGSPDEAPLPLALLRNKLHACIIASHAGVQLTGTLADIMASTVPSQPYVRFYERHLSRCLVQVLAAPPRSAEREERRRAAIQECVHMIVSPKGGCCTPLPYEAAVWLWEEEEELRGGNVGNHSMHNLAVLASGSNLPLLSSVGALNQVVAAALAVQVGYKSGPLGGAPKAPGTPPLTGSATPLSGHATPGRAPNTPRGPSGLMSPLKSFSKGPSRQESLDYNHEMLATRRVTDLGLRFVHQFPGAPAAQAVWGRILRGKFLKDPRAPSAADARRKISTMLATAMEAGAPTASGWKALAGLLYQSLQYSAALRASEEGSAWLEAQATAGHEYLSQCALFLKVIHARSLLKLGRVDEAEHEFTILADWVTEGEAAFGTMAGSRPMSIHQQALRGLAQVALYRGDRQTAKQRYERILGAALMGRGAAEHWAHAEYGWMAFEDGDLALAESQLRTALEIASQPSCGATGTELARHQYMLGRVYDAMGGEHKTDKQYAYTEFLAAASHEGPHQAAALAWLGRWLQDVAHDSASAKKCYARALKLDSSLATAGEGMCAVLRQTGGLSAEQQLCEGILARTPLGPPAWALKRLGFIQLQQADHEDADEKLKLLEAAAVHFQRCLRLDSNEARVWEGMGSALQQLNRLTAAQKAYSRALSLQPQLPFALSQLAILHAALRQTDDALRLYVRARQLDMTDISMLLGEAEARISRASVDLAKGYPSLAASDLAAAAAAAREATALQPGLVGAWKLLGDALLMHHSCTPVSPLAEELRTRVPTAEGVSSLLVQLQSNESATACVDSLREMAEALQLRRSALQEAQRAYQTAVDLQRDARDHMRDDTRDQKASLMDLAASLHHEAHLLRCHPAVAAAAEADISALLQRCAALLRTVLEADPVNARAWAGLGATSSQVDQQEYALIRSLELDRKDAQVWTALGQLYGAEGAPDLGTMCFDQARCLAPATGIVWEGMAIMQLSVFGDQSGALQALQQAVELGPGPNTLANWAALQLAKQSQRALGTTPHAGVRSLDLTSVEDRDVAIPLILAVARRAVAAQPADATARHTYGAALLLNGDAAEAVKQLLVAEQLLCSFTDNEHAPVELVNRPQATVAVRLSLATAQVEAGNVRSGLSLFESLMDRVCWDTEPAAALSYAAALCNNNRAAEAVDLLKNLLVQLPHGCKAWACCLQHLVNICCDANDIALAGCAMEMLQLAVDALQDGHVDNDTSGGVIQRAILRLLTHVAQQPCHDSNEAESDAKHYRHTAERCHVLLRSCMSLDAEVAAAVAVLQAKEGSRVQALHSCASAVHMCPWSVCHRLALANAALECDMATYASSAAALIDPLLKLLLTSSTAPEYSGSHTDLLRKAAQLMVKGSLGPSLQSGAFPTQRARLCVRLRLLRALLHAQPHVWLWWALVALVSVRLFEVSHYCGLALYDEKQAGLWCRRALARWEERNHNRSNSYAAGSGGDENGSSGSAAEVKGTTLAGARCQGVQDTTEEQVEDIHILAHLHLALSELNRLLGHEPGAWGLDEATTALELLRSAKQPTDAAVLQLTRCHLSLGHHDKAVAALEAACRERQPSPLLIWAMHVVGAGGSHPVGIEWTAALKALQQAVSEGSDCSDSHVMQRHMQCVLGIVRVMSNVAMETSAAGLSSAGRTEGQGDADIDAAKTLHPFLRDAVLGVHARMAAACAAALDTDRKAKGRMDSHIRKVLREWPVPVPTAVFAILAHVTGDKRFSRMALHQRPWDRQLWDRS